MTGIASLTLLLPSQTASAISWGPGAIMPVSLHEVIILAAKGHAKGGERGGGFEQSENSHERQAACPVALDRRPERKLTTK